MMLTDTIDLSNFITYMSVRGATLEEQQRMISYSMKVIDLKILYRDLDIEELVQKYGKEERI